MNKIRESIRSIRQKVPVQAYTVEELAFLYQVTAPTIRKWIAPFEEVIGQKRGWFYTIKQVEIIFEKLGHPERL